MDADVLRLVSFPHQEAIALQRLNHFTLTGSTRPLSSASDVGSHPLAPRRCRRVTSAHDGVAEIDRQDLRAWSPSPARNEDSHNRSFGRLGDMVLRTLKWTRMSPFTASLIRKRSPSGVEPLHRAGHVKQRVIALTRNIGFAGVRMTSSASYSGANSLTPRSTLSCSAYHGYLGFVNIQPVFLNPCPKSGDVRGGCVKHLAHHIERVPGAHHRGKSSLLRLPVGRLCRERPDPPPPGEAYRRFPLPSCACCRAPAASSSSIPRPPAAPARCGASHSPAAGARRPLPRRKLRRRYSQGHSTARDRLDSRRRRTVPAPSLTLRLNRI
jgi:hypothetical protein